MVFSKNISSKVLLALHYVFGTVLSVYSLGPNASGPVIETNVGPIRGLRAEDGDYSMFLGIPYAKVDADNPFGPARPYPLFEDTFDAFDDSAICPQIEEFNNTVVGTLDCLHLNIYVPNNASAVNRLPVMVWIYGGLMSVGFAGRYLYGPSFLVRHDIVLVTFNYRLGPYGFMCLDIPEVSGNQGLKDQVKALRWIKENIAAFGGDDTKITIAGNSAGAISVDYHAYYSQEELFQRIICQSGAALNNFVKKSNPNAPIKLAKYFNHSTNDLRDALSFLATLHTEQIIAASKSIALTFSPCVETIYKNVENFITEHPLLVDTLKAKDIDVLIGFNNDEEYPYLSEMDDRDFKNKDYLAFALKGFNFETEDFIEMRDIVRHFYLGDDELTGEFRQPVMDMLSDFRHVYPTLRTVKKYIDNEVKTLYLYLFSYSGRRNFNKHRLNITGGGATHADELGYLFDISYMKKPLDPEDQLIVDRITELWANFVKYGNPTPEPTELVPVRWPTVTRDKWHYLELDSTLRVAARPLHARAAFLELFYKMNERYEIGFRQSSAGHKFVLNLSVLLLVIVIII